MSYYRHEYDYRQGWAYRQALHGPYWWELHRDPEPKEWKPKGIDPWVRQKIEEQRQDARRHTDCAAY
jgi:hypothetical protein